MRAMFSKNFDGVTEYMVNKNLPMISSGKNYYKKFIPMMQALSEVTLYRPLYLLYHELEIPIHTPFSKRAFYEEYSRGIVVGAGSGEDCSKLSESNWKLFDMVDPNYIRLVVGHTPGIVEVNILNSDIIDGSTLMNVDEKNIDTQEMMEVTTLDKACRNFDPEVIAIDGEGTGFDILAGATKLIAGERPDILVSVYHNWLEYLHIIPFLYDMGYTISVGRLSNNMPIFPHLELAVFAKWEE